MLVNVAEVKREEGAHERVDLHVSLKPIESGGSPVRFDQPFAGEAEVWNLGDRLLVRGELEGEAQLVCSRCLTEYQSPLEVEFEEEFVEGTDLAAILKDDEAETGRQVNLYQGEQIDLTETLRDNVVVELPMKPLCSPDCKGLCPTCGANLNQGPCSCTEDVTVDPRFAKLHELLRKPDSKNE
ncbi:MAG TPA: DUF177 domain-containing protein [Symbiobacteriaceae bacterium]|nr:DUF177 domain-containing protein [Symbiobacteriaceae bacterium]